MVKRIEPFEEEFAAAGRKTYTELQQENAALRKEIKRLQVPEWGYVRGEGSANIHEHLETLEPYQVISTGYAREVLREFIFIDETGDIHVYPTLDEANDAVSDMLAKESEK